MRYFAFLLGFVLLLSISSSAQTTASNSVLLPSSYYAVPGTFDAPTNAPAIALTPFSNTPANAPPGAFVPSTPLSLSLLPAPPASARRHQRLRELFLADLWRLHFHAFFRTAPHHAEYERLQLQRRLLLERLVRRGWRARGYPRNAIQRKLLVPVRRRRSAFSLVREKGNRNLGARSGRLFALHASDARRSPACFRLRTWRRR